MNRDVAFSKLRVVCEEFDRAVHDEDDLLPLSAWLFGSLLTGKPEPADIDLLVQFDESRWAEKALQKEFVSVQNNLWDFHRAAQAYCKGMRRIQIEIVPSNQAVENWFLSRNMPLDTPHVLIWEAGKAWPAVLEDLRLHPLHSYEPQAEHQRKAENQRGEKRILPVIQLIRRKLHVQKHDWADAVFEPLGIHRGIGVCATSDSCPPEFADILTVEGYRHVLENGAAREIVEVGRVYWVWNADSDDIAGLGVLIFRPFERYKSQAEAWIRQNISLLFDRAKEQRLPVLEVICAADIEPQAAGAL